jgi:hypothetical protein
LDEAGPRIRKRAESKEQDLYPVKSNPRLCGTDLAHLSQELKDWEGELKKVGKWAQSSPLTQRRTSAILESIGSCKCRMEEIRERMQHEERLLFEIRQRHEKEDEEFYRKPEIARIRELKQQIWEGWMKADELDTPPVKLSPEILPRLFYD